MPPSPKILEARAVLKQKPWATHCWEFKQMGDRSLFIHTVQFKGGKSYTELHETRIISERCCQRPPCTDKNVERRFSSSHHTHHVVRESVLHGAIA